VSGALAPSAPALRSRRRARRADLGLSEREYALLEPLDTPQKIQAFLNGMPANFELEGETCRPVRQVLRHRCAHCIEGALVAACALWMHGDPPLVINLRAENDDDHALALFRRAGRWGAISKTNAVFLRYRDPVYRSLRELALSYVHEYANRRGERTLRAYSRVFDLRRIDPKIWVGGPEDCWDLGGMLLSIRHYPILSPAEVGMLSRRDPMERQVGRMLQYPRPAPPAGARRRSRTAA
jgi:hypothetical protein